MKDTLFLQHCDPRQNFSASQVLALINLHALLLKEVVIQDNFLISKLFFDIYNISPKNSFPHLFYEKVLNIASRDTLDHSIINLKDDLFTKAVNDIYIPFEGKEEGLELYQNREFTNYIQTFEKITNKRKDELRDWSPNELGLNLKRHLFLSATNNTSGIESTRAIEIINEIDSLATGYHSRSLYYSYINQMANSVEKAKVRAWVNAVYLKNLPDSLNIGISIPNRQLTNDFQYNHLSNLESDNVFERANVLGEIDGTLLNFEFLSNLHPESILEIRKFNEFSELQNSVEQNSPDLAKHLTDYLKRISDEAPKYYEPYREKIKKLELLKKGKTYLTEALDFYNIIAFDPVSPKITGVLSFALKKVKYLDSRIDKTKDASETELSKNKTDSLVKNLGEVIHKLE